MKALSFLFLLTYSLFLKAQTHISGKVRFKNKPVSGVSVSIKDSYDGSTTDAEGNYNFETAQKGSHTIVFSHYKYNTVEQQVLLDNKDLKVDATLKESFSEIEAVVITAGSIEASDKNRASALLTPLDIYTIAGSDAQISKALEYLPGVQKIGESEGLFIRGGSGTESKIFIDGSLVNNYYTASVPGIAGRDRFNTSLFKGNVFSSGGYSALYGQALSGILQLESIDLPHKSFNQFAISPFFVNAGFQKLNSGETFSNGATAGYTDLGLIMKLMRYNMNFVTPPKNFNADANFRFKTKSGGMLKYYGQFTSSKMALETKSLEPEADRNIISLNNTNTYHNLSFRQKFGRFILNVGSSYTHDVNHLEFSGLRMGEKQFSKNLDNTGDFANVKTVVERRLSKISAVRGGFELNYSHERNNYGKKFQDLISAAFLETDLGFSNRFSLKAGLRAEQSNYLNKGNLAPRLALAYRLSDKWVTSLAYGTFYQNPESKYINSNAKLGFQNSQHYIFQLERNTEGRRLRLEAYYKTYDHLIKTVQGTYAQTATSNAGNGYAKGLEVFWKDSKSLKAFDYWLSYSYLNTKRDFNKYPTALVPNFAARHSFAALAKKFVVNWKTGFNVSYTYSSRRSYYDIISTPEANILRKQGLLKSFSSLNFSMNYLPNLGKNNTVLVISISNILGNKNIYGYNFSKDGLRSAAVVPPINTFSFIGAFFSFGVDRTQEVINNNL